MVPGTLKRWLVSGCVLLAIPFLAACVVGPEASGSFDRSLSVSGPVRLEISNAAGRAEIRPGPANQVEIQARVKVAPWPWQNAGRISRQVTGNPPVEQDGNVIVISSPGHFHDVSIDYVITVPAMTSLKASSASCDYDVRGIHGPANISTASGDVGLSGISSDVQISTASGDMKLSDIGGNLDTTSASGDLEAHNVQGTIRARSASGDARIWQAVRGANISSSSGDITLRGAAGDLQLHSVSGDITVMGDPGDSGYWEFRTTSGDVDLSVPSTAGFRLFLHSSSGDIKTSIPLVIDEQASRHELRAHVGSGAARIEVRTTSGSITLH
jgi:DUF4097 and DUF4098 domain-containing protein YvlB